jgi:hypothetical protein
MPALGRTSIYCENRSATKLPLRTVLVCAVQQLPYGGLDHDLSSPVCTENVAHVDLATESHNHPGRCSR